MSDVPAADETFRAWVREFTAALEGAGLTPVAGDDGYSTAVPIDPNLTVYSLGRYEALPVPGRPDLIRVGKRLPDHPEDT